VDIPVVVLAKDKKQAECSLNDCLSSFFASETIEGKKVQKSIKIY
jgi:hypothetical protein